MEYKAPAMGLAPPRGPLFSSVYVNVTTAVQKSNLDRNVNYDEIGADLVQQNSIAQTVLRSTRLLL